MPFSLKNYSPPEPLESGKKSNIFRATHLHDSTKVVIKKIGVELFEQHALIQRFATQTDAVGKLQHENIIRVYDHGYEQGSYYLSMEYIDGFDLERFFSARFYTPDLGLMVVYQALKGLQFAHSHGVAHCDIKPANILIGQNGTVKLADFGMDLGHTVLHENDQLSVVFATPLYMSPEQAAVIKKQELESEFWAETNPLTAGELLPKTSEGLKDAFSWDIWSAGIVLYQICANQPPFGGATLSELAESIISKKEPALPPQWYTGSASIGTIVHACLKKNPAERLASVQPILTALETHFGSLPEPNPRQALLKCFLPVPPKSHRPKKSAVPKEPQTAKTPKQVAEVAPLIVVKKKAKPAVLAGAGAAFILLLVVALMVLTGKKPASNASVPLQTKQAQATALANTNPLPAAAALNTPVDTIPAIPDTVPATSEAGTPLAEEAKPLKSEPSRISGTENRIRERSASQKSGRSSPPAPKKYGTIVLIVDPPDAKISIDEKRLSVSELELGKQLDPGPHSMVVQLDGYEPYSESISITAGSRKTFSVNLTRVQQGYGMLHIYSYPWSNVYVDQTLLGTAPTPNPLSLLEGPHALELRRNGYVTHRESIEIIKGQTTRIQVDLEKAELVTE